MSAVTMMWSLSFLIFSSAKCSDLVMFVCIGLLVKVLRILDTMVEVTAVHTIEFTCLENCHSSSSLMGMVGGVTTDFGSFCTDTS